MSTMPIYCEAEYAGVSSAATQSSDNYEHLQDLAPFLTPMRADMFGYSMSPPLVPLPQNWWDLYDPSSLYCSAGSTIGSNCFHPAPPCIAQSAPPLVDAFPSWSYNHLEPFDWNFAPTLSPLHHPSMCAQPSASSTSLHIPRSIPEDTEMNTSLVQPHDSPSAMTISDGSFYALDSVPAIDANSVLSHALPDFTSPEVSVTSESTVVADPVTIPAPSSTLTLTNSSSDIWPIQPHVNIANPPVKRAQQTGSLRNFMHDESQVPGGRQPLTLEQLSINPVSSARKKHQASISASSSRSRGVSTLDSIMFSIDADGKARAESTVVTDRRFHRRHHSDERAVSLSTITSNQSQLSMEDGSVILPSQPSSFRILSHHLPARSPPGHKLGAFGQDMMNRVTAINNDDSEAESASDATDNAGAADEIDATNELRRVRSLRQSQSHKTRRSATRIVRRRKSLLDGYPRPVNQILKETVRVALQSWPDAGARKVGCVCDEREAGGRTEYMVQCKSCDMWLHGKCVNIGSPIEEPTIYICAFCAGTPTGRLASIRDRNRDGDRDHHWERHHQWDPFGTGPPTAFSAESSPIGHRGLRPYW